MRAEVDAAVAARAAGGGRRGSAVDEGELVRRARAGERGALAALLARHGGALLRFSRALARDDVTAGELVRDTWFTLLGGPAGLDERAPLRTRLLGILASAAKERAIRGVGVALFPAVAEPGGGRPAVDPRRFDPSGTWADPPAEWTDDTPEELAAGPETGAVMEETVDDLPAAERAVLVLRDVEGLDPDEIRDLLDIAAPDQRRLLHRARERVRRALEERERASARGGVTSTARH